MTRVQKAPYVTAWFFAGFIGTMLARTGANMEVTGGSGTVPLLVGVAITLLGIGALLGLLHQGWTAIQPGKPRTTPDKAVGLLLVPVFNFYWIFQAIWGWARDFNAHIREKTWEIRMIPEGLALAVCILMPFELLPPTGAHPLLAALGSLRLVNLVLVFVLIHRVVNGINELTGAEERAAIEKAARARRAPRPATPRPSKPRPAAPRHPATTIHCPVSVVWSYVTTLEHWKGWHGAGLVGVDPGWQKDAVLTWENGDTTRIAACVPGRSLRLDGGFLRTTYSFSAVGDNATRVKIAAQPTGGASFADGGRAHRSALSAALRKLKKQVEASAPAAAPVAGAKPKKTRARPSCRFKRYDGSGVCDVCNKPIASGEAFEVPTEAFWSSRKYRAWAAQNPLIGGMLQAMGATMDQYIAMQRAMDATASSAVCPDCVHLFE